MPADKGNDDAERFAVALELGRPPGSADADLLRDLEIAAALRTRGAAFSPHPDAKARARARLMAALAAEAPLDTPPTERLPATEFRTAFPTPRTGARPADATDTGSPDAGSPDAGSTGAGSMGTDDTTPTEQLPVVTAHPAAAGPATAVLPAAAPFSPGPSAGGSSTGSAGGTAGRRRRPGRHTLPGRPPARAAAGRSALRRGLLVGSAALAGIFVLAGTSMFASSAALPGDSLYALKRASESAGLAVTFDDQARAYRHLDIATTRIDEIEQLVARPSAPADAEVFRSAIAEFDASTGEGSRMLLAAPDPTEADLDGLRTWADDQATRLEALRPALPAEAGADSSIEFLDRLAGRADALRERSACDEVTTDAADEFGPVPAEGTCTPRATGSSPRGPESPVAPGSVDQAEPAAPTTTDVTDPEEPTTGSGPAPDTNEPTDDATDDGPPPGGTVDRGGNVSGGTPTTTAPTTRSVAPPPPAEDGGEVNVPLPVVPPVTLPPLLPGAPGITLGG